MQLLLTSIFLAFSLFALLGCGNTSKPVGNIVRTQQTLPKWTVRIKSSIQHADGLSYFPQNAYFFPPLLMDEENQPINKLFPATNPAGRLFWQSDTPNASEIQQLVKGVARQNGFVLLDFDSLNRVEHDHTVLVFNTYFTEPRAEVYKGYQTGRWLSSLRMTASTYAATLDPASRKDLLSAEALVLFSSESFHLDVVKRGFRYLNNHLKRPGITVESISLLN